MKKYNVVIVGGGYIGIELVEALVVVVTEIQI